MATEGNEEIGERADHLITIPEAELFQPMLTVVPLQLLAYHAAVLRGRRGQATESRQERDGRMILP